MVGLTANLQNVFENAGLDSGKNPGWGIPLRTSCQVVVLSGFWFWGFVGFCFLGFFFCYFRAAPSRHMEVPRLGVKLDL